jgi:hypothetical protein
MSSVEVSSNREIAVFRLGQDAKQDVADDCHNMSSCVRFKRVRSSSKVTSRWASR